ncbi:hypothetical protein RhiirA5_377374 [Rhizophagus irregularis]|uniref:Uncharacterized protein n=1 Tax=Rhizophagus irregularis TaxID=588596 RepID=A0A2I1EP72_9GLOM|nr:hypothetical protein RhiirA5_377374 [Rhizophagus irregularis]PKC62703.1 hypothetical protein RhiirA1_464782 [Rhizophagus irregularis]PKY23916.1 hypothetical protein RhiirB3_387602 [Rhizophagus irregularis]CAB4480554.1 unnamed protein product [Rhizophagus irregularis]CAB5209180.1 unnamed protein product [Rhizophagus irregularis]
MKPQSFYILTVFFMCLFVLKSQATKVSILENVGAFCRIWIEDSNHKRIAGDGKGHYRVCDTVSYNHIEFSDQEYYIVAKVLASFEKQKRRGPFKGEHYCSIHGEVDSWDFDC